jgi:hypothetical protein
MAFEDLLKDSSFPLDNKNYFNVIITDLKLNQLYPLQFRWKYEDGSFSTWSAVKAITTPGPTVPDQPDLRSTDVIGKPGFIEVTWNGNNAASQPISNIDRVDIHISGQSFGDGTKPAGSFRVAGTQTFAATPGSYTVQLKAYTINGSSSFFSTARTVTITAVGEAIQTPTLPTGLTATPSPFAVSINWNGSYSSATSFTGFKSIDIYAVSSDLGSTATSGITDTNLVGSLTVNNIPNKINIGLDNLRQALSLESNSAAYTATIFFYYISVNRDGTKFGSPTYTRINSSSVVPIQANYVDIANGVISIENLVAGNGTFAAWLRAGTAGGARIELSAVNNFTNGGYTVKKGLTAYSSGSTETLGFDLSTGALSLAGSLAATSISTSSGKFAVNSSGILTATDVNLTGAITATTGNVGGLIIAADAIQNGSTSGNSTFRLDSTGKARFGSATGNSVIIDPSGNIYTSPNGGTSTGNFQVSNGNVTITGVITATSGSFTGAIFASSGTFTGTISGTDITGSSFTNVSGGQGVTIARSGTLDQITFQSGGSTSGVIASGAATGATGIQITASGGTSSGFATSTNGSAAIFSSSSGGIQGLTITSGGVAQFSSNVAFNNGNLTSTANTGTSIVLGQAQSSDISNGAAGRIQLNGDGSIYANTLGTTTGTPNIRQASGYLRFTSSSSERYKNSIVDIKTVNSLDPYKLLEIPVRAFKYNNGYIPDTDQRFNTLIPGLIAEEVEEFYPIAVDYNEDKPETWVPNYIIPGMLVLIKDLSDRLDALEG